MQEQFARKFENEIRSVTVNIERLFTVFTSQPYYIVMSVRDISSCLRQVLR